MLSSVLKSKIAIQKNTNICIFFKISFELLTQILEDTKKTDDKVMGFKPETKK